MRKHLLYLFMLFCGLTGIVQAETPEVVPTQTIADPTPTANGGFGWGTCIAGDYMFITKSAEKTTSGGTFRGRVGVYKKTDGQWKLDDTLYPDDVAGLWYGNALACDGTTLVVGVPESTSGDKAGYIMIYTKNAAGKWVSDGNKYRQKTARSGAKLGVTLAVDGNVIVAGGYQYNSNQGTVTVFYKGTDGTWSAIEEKEGAAASALGRAVTVNGTRVLVGAPTLGVFSYDMTKADYGQQVVAQIPSNTASGQGYSLSVCGDYFLMGSAPDNKAYLYKCVNDTWDLVQIIANPDASLVSFGYNVVLKENGALIVTNNKGKAYLYKRNASGLLVEVATLVPGDTDAAGNFGYSASFDGTQCIIGRNTYKTGATTTGLALYYDVSSYLKESSTLPTITPTQNVADSTPTANGGFGWGTCIAGDYMFITKSAEKTTSGGTFRGRVGVYKKTDGQWKLDDTLYPDDVAGLWYGNALACDGTTLVVGVPESTSGDKAGYIMIYTKNAAGKWVSDGNKYRQKTARSGAKLGVTLAVDGNVIVAGGYQYNSNQGTVTVFYKGTDGTWSAIEEKDGVASSVLGRAVSVNGKRVLVGAPTIGVFCYDMTKDGYGQEIVPQIPSNTSSGQGYSLSVCGDYFLMGSAADNKAYLYKCEDDAWSLVQTIENPDASLTSFGYNVVLKENGALIVTNNKGKAYLYSRDDSGMLIDVAALVTGDTDAAGNFGFSASFDGTQCIIGRNTYKTGTTTTGLAHYYDLSSYLPSAPVNSVSTTKDDVVIKIATVDNGIVIMSGVDAVANVYDLTGKCVVSKIVKEGDTTIELPKGVYIVQCAGKTLKIIL